MIYIIGGVLMIGAGVVGLVWELRSKPSFVRTVLSILLLFIGELLILSQTVG